MKIMKAAKKPGLSVFHVVLSLLSFMIFAGDVCALIPEPENIIYGTAPLEGEVISLKIGDQEIASYRVAEHPEKAGYYVLRVSIESFDPQNTAIAHPLDIANLYVDSVALIDPDTGTSFEIVIGNRGTIQLFNFDTTDSDGDGLLDQAENYLGTNMFNADTDGDGLQDGEDINPLKADHDGDGFDDSYEITAGTNPDDKNDMPVVYVDQANEISNPPPNGSKEYPYLTIEKGVQEAADYYTVLVAAGVYPENLSITKEIRLVGTSPTETIIDGGGTGTVVEYAGATGDKSSVEQFTIRNADTGIAVGSGSPLINNNVLTGMSTNGISCEGSSAARIINNTIAGNPSGSGITSSSTNVTVVNTIISHNSVGLTCVGVPGMVQAYNNLWENSVSNESGCATESSNVSVDPLYADMAGGDFRLYLGSSSVDAGDPLEILSTNYDGTNTIYVDIVTNMSIENRIWITNGSDEETGIVAVVNTGANSIELKAPLMYNYSTAANSHICTSTSFCENEPEATRSRIDMGAYGNTPEAGGFVWRGDLNTDRNVDLMDLILGLKVLTNSAPAGKVYTGDVDGNGHVGMVEVLHIIKNASK